MLPLTAPCASEGEHSLFIFFHPPEDEVRTGKIYLIDKKPGAAATFEPREPF